MKQTILEKKNKFVSFIYMTFAEQHVGLNTFLRFQEEGSHASHIGSSVNSGITRNMSTMRLDSHH